MNTLVLSCFPAVGKTWVYDHQEELGLKVIDSDSSSFSWIERKRTEEELAEEKRKWEETPHLLSGDGYINKIKNELIKDRNPEFPKNYIKHIKENIGKCDLILVSSHEDVRKALTEAGIYYCVVFPSYELYHEYIGRCYLREKEGKQGFPIKVLEMFWTSWVKSCFDDTSFRYPIFRPGKYLSDYLPEIIGSDHYIRKDDINDNKED